MNSKLPIALFLAATSACLNNASTGDELDSETAVASAIEMENGGLDTTDEAPEFAEPDAYAAAEIENERSVDDPMRLDARVDSMDRAVSAVRHRVLLAWGRFPVDRTATNARDWSGSIRTSRGALVIGRTVGFEDATDRVLPRDTPDRVDFRSITRPFADGLLLRVIDPDPTAGPIRLTYTSADGSVTRELDLGQLATGPLSVDAGDGNRVIAVALRDRADTCEHGFIRGRWVALREGLGAYRGVITDADGERIGHIRGMWGKRRNGDAVMFGKFIANDGSFKGLLVGTYENGQWHARWTTRAGDHGLAGGLYIDAPEMRGGVFGGRYGETGCAE